MLAAAIEETAWEGFEDHAGMLGSRPIAAAELAQPDLEEASAEYEATHQQAPEPVPELELEPVSLEDVRGVLARLSAQGHTAKVRELIVKAGADKLSAVDPSKFGWLLERAKEIADGIV